MTPSWLSEPLVHFVAIGLLIFSIDGLVSPGADDNTLIAIDETLKSDLADQFLQATQRAPTPGELDQMIEGWIQKEILYREGVALGLERSDGLIRDRVISLVRALTINAVTADTPTEAELRDYFQRNSGKYFRPRQYDLEHFIIGNDEPAASAKAETLLDALGAGQNSGDVGRRLMRIHGRSAAQLAAIFGAGFPDLLDAMPVGRWATARSNRGWHIVRIDAIAPESTPGFQEIRKRVEDDWRQDRKLQEFATRYREMRANYTVVVVDDRG